MNDLVKLNFRILNPGELEPSEIFDAFTGMVKRVMAHVPDSSREKNPLDRGPSQEEIERKQIENEIFFE